MENICKYEIVQRTSKNGNLYHMIVLTFENGYTCELFVNNEQYFCIVHQ